MFLTNELVYQLCFEWNIWASLHTKESLTVGKIIASAISWDSFINLRIENIAISYKTINT